MDICGKTSTLADGTELPLAVILRGAARDRPSNEVTLQTESLTAALTGVVSANSEESKLRDFRGAGAEVADLPAGSSSDDELLDETTLPILGFGAAGAG